MANPDLMEVCIQDVPRALKAQQQENKPPPPRKKQGKRCSSAPLPLLVREGPTKATTVSSHDLH